MVWVGAASNAKFVLESLSRGEWSAERLEQYESIRGELVQYAKLASEGELDRARTLARDILVRADAQPTRMTDLAQAMTAFIQGPEDVELVRAFVQRAVQETDRVDASRLSDAASALQLIGDSDGASAAARSVLQLCRTMKSDCEGESAALERYTRCPTVLARAPARKGNEARRTRYVLELAKGAAPDCR